MMIGRRIKIVLSLLLVVLVTISASFYIYFNPKEKIFEEDVEEVVMGKEDASGVPYIVSLPPIVGYERVLYEYLVRVVSIYEERNLSLEYLEGPEWLKVSGMVLRGTPPLGSSGSYRIVLKISDGYNSSVQESYILIEENEIQQEDI